MFGFFSVDLTKPGFIFANNAGTVIKCQILLCRSAADILRWKPVCSCSLVPETPDPRAHSLQLRLLQLHYSGPALLCSLKNHSRPWPQGCLNQSILNSCPVNAAFPAGQPAKHSRTHTNEGIKVRLCTAFMTRLRNRSMCGGNLSQTVTLMLAELCVNNFSGVSVLTQTLCEVQMRVGCRFSPWWGIV